MNGILRIAVAIGICIILYILAGCGPGEEMGTIVFTSNRNGNAEIYSMRADGKKQKRLTKNECSDEAPWWSPDRSRLVFTSDRTGNWDIFVMNADGTSPVQLTNSEKDDRFPCWSPDGKKILFQSNQEGRYELYIMNPDGTDLRRIKIREEVPPPGKKKVLKAPIKKDISKEIKPEYTHPVWFPNCSSLIYMKESKTGASLWKTGMDGKKPEQLTRTKKWDMCPSVAPDGSRILFSSNESDEFQIYMLDENGKNRTLINILYVNPDYTEPRWSPKGEYFVFVSNASGNKEIYRKKFISGNEIESLQKKKDREKRLTKNKADDYQPCW